MSGNGLARLFVDCIDLRVCISIVVANQIRALTCKYHNSSSSSSSCFWKKCRLLFDSAGHLVHALAAHPLHLINGVLLCIAARPSVRLQCGERRRYRRRGPLPSPPHARL